METFSALLAICAGNSPVPGEFLAQRPVTRSFGAFFDLHPNKRMSKQWWGWWFETPSFPLWRHRNEKTLEVHTTDPSCGWESKDHRYISLRPVECFCLFVYEFFVVFLCEPLLEPTSCAHQWGQYTTARIITRRSKKFNKIFCFVVIVCYTERKHSGKLSFSESFGIIFIILPTRVARGKFRKPHF